MRCRHVGHLAQRRGLDIKSRCFELTSFIKKTLGLEKVASLTKPFVSKLLFRAEFKSKIALLLPCFVSITVLFPEWIAAADLGDRFEIIDSDFLIKGHHRTDTTIHIQAKKLQTLTFKLVRGYFFRSNENTQSGLAWSFFYNEKTFFTFLMITWTFQLEALNINQFDENFRQT